MQLPTAMLGFPVTLLTLIVSRVEAQQLPTAVRKMSLDDGEKILPHYMDFAPVYAPLQSPLKARTFLTQEEVSLLAANSSAYLPYRPPFGVLQGEESQERRDGGVIWRGARQALHRLQGRSWSCPDNTFSCSSIGQPNYCCATGETCYTVQNAPDAGNVGCCPDGQNCAGSVGSCGSGSTACSAQVGGGCCIAGFVCAQIGCVASSVSVITMTTTSSTVISAPSPTTQITTVVVTVSPSVQTSTEISTVTQTSTADTTTGASTVTSALPPYRPTSGTDTITEVTSSTATADYCPTGFYACLATAGSGCCRTGRDCVTTSCPPIASTTITSNGVTLVVPASDVPTITMTSTCAGGWFLCPSSVGPVAGCCPSGYSCGTASCTLSATTATATVQKELPSEGSRGAIHVWGLVTGMTAFLIAYLL